MRDTISDKVEFEDQHPDLSYDLHKHAVWNIHAFTHTHECACIHIQLFKFSSFSTERVVELYQSEAPKTTKRLRAGPP